MLTGDDLEFYVRNFDYVNYAMPMYEQAVMDILNDRRAIIKPSSFGLKKKWLIHSAATSKGMNYSTC